MLWILLALTSFVSREPDHPVFRGFDVLESRRALVIGIDLYPGYGLVNAVKDARIMGQSLRDAGFQVNLLENITKSQFEDALEKFGKRKGGGVGLFYFAGHGYSQDGHQYLLPAQSRLNEPKALGSQSISLERVVDVTVNAKCRTGIVILDSCRNIPGDFGTIRPISRLPQKKKLWLTLAARPGSRAYDGIFTPILAKNMAITGLTLPEVFNKTRYQVAEETMGKQIPIDIIATLGDFYFHPPESSDDQGVQVASRKEGNRSAITDNEMIYQLGLEYVRRGDYEKAIQYLKAAAEGQSESAQNDLGVLYLKTGSKRLAEHWFIQAARGKSPTAMYNLGFLYFRDGETTEANKYFEKAALLGNDMAKVYHGNALAQAENYQDARIMLESAVENGNTFAMLQLGILYANNLLGEKKLADSARKAEHLYLRAVAVGNVKARKALLDLYRTHRTVFPDKELVIKQLEAWIVPHQRTNNPPP